MLCKQARKSGFPGTNIPGNGYMHGTIFRFSRGLLRLLKIQKFGSHTTSF